MKLIKKISGVNLSISEVLSKSIWASPNIIIDENNEYIELTQIACNQVAKMSGLRDFKSAQSLYENSPGKWQVFSDFFSSLVEGRIENFCYTNDDQTVIYSFLENSLEDEVDELDKLYAGFELRGVPPKYLFVKEEPVIVSIENKIYETFHVNVFTIFDPSKSHLLCFAVKVNNTGEVKVKVLFDNDLVGKNHKFICEDLDYSLFEYDIINDDVRPCQIDETFAFSLKEIIQAMRTLQSTKHLAVDAAAFGGIFIEKYGEIRQSISEEIDNVYNKLGSYFFYFNDEPTFVEDFSLIHDKLKSPKASLYFCEKLKYNDLLMLFSQVIKYDIERIMFFGNSYFDISYLLDVITHLVYLQEKEDFDIYTIRHRWS